MRNLILLGHSCSGKSSLQDYICSRNFVCKVRLVTDRPKRTRSEDDYIFVSAQEYDRWLEDGYLLFSTEYTNADGKILRYGLPKNILQYPKISKCFILGPDAYEKLFESSDKVDLGGFTPVYIYSSFNDLLHRSGQRDLGVSGRNEFFRRYEADEIKFAKLKKEGKLPIVIENNQGLDELYLKLVDELTED